MLKFRKTFTCILALFTMFFFVGCGNNSEPTTSPDNNPDYSIVDSEIIGDEDAKNFFKESTLIVYNYIDKINSLLKTNSSISQSQDFVSVSDLIELILNKALFVNNEREIFENKENELTTENVYAKISKFSSNISSNFARLSVKSIKQGITFSLVSENANEDLLMLRFDVELRNEKIKTISIKCAETQEENKIYSIYGFIINIDNNTMDLFFGQPETNEPDLIDFIWNNLSSEIDNQFWAICMACSFNFSDKGIVLPFISTGKRLHVRTSSYPRFKQNIIDSKFNECCLDYMDFDALYDNKKVIENDKSKFLFENLKTNYIKYNSQDTAFKII